jgi:hypothetical protein
MPSGTSIRTQGKNFSNFFLAGNYLPGYHIGMSDNKPSNPEGRVNIPLGTQKHKELVAMAKKNGTKPGPLGRALLLDGMARVKKGEVDLAAGITINQKD